MKACVKNMNRKHLFEDQAFPLAIRSRALRRLAKCLGARLVEDMRRIWDLGDVVDREREFLSGEGICLIERSGSSH